MFLHKCHYYWRGTAATGVCRRPGYWCLQKARLLMPAEGQVVSAAVPEVGAALVAVAGLLVLGLHHTLHGGHGGQDSTTIQVTFVSKLNLDFFSLFQPF